MNADCYLDHNATSPLRPGARAALEHVLDLVGNGSSVHADGRRVRALIEDARETVARFVGVDRDALVFTSGATEANNQVLRAAATAGRRILVSAIEHPSVAALVPDAGRIPVTSDGIVDLDALDALLVDDAENALVAVMAANNETGVIQPITEIAEIVRRHGAVLHCDAVQALGKIAFDAGAMGAHTYAISGHKIGAPAGVGALIIAEPLARPDALIVGGGQETYRRAGTENLLGIAGFAGAVNEVASNWHDEAIRLAELRDALEARIGEGAVLAGREAPRLPNTTNIILRGIDSETQVMALDLAGIRVSAGAACSSGKVSRSAVLEAMGFAAEDAGSAIRVSLGWTTENSHTNAFVDAWTKLAERRPAAA